MNELASAPQRFRTTHVIRFLMPFLLLASVGLTAFSWAASSPIGASPDEPAHIRYAWGVVTGQVMPWSIEETTSDSGKSIVNVDVPGDLTQYPNPACYARKDYSALCTIPEGDALETDTTVTSYMAKYPMLYYGIVGAVMRVGLAVGLSGFSTLFAARFVSGLVSYVLIGAAAIILGRRYNWKAVAITASLCLVPNSHFLFSSINPNGFEISAAMLLGAVVVAIRHDVNRDGKVGRSLQVGLLVSALLLGWTRPLSIAWMGLLLLLLIVPVNGRHVIKSISRWTFVLILGLAALLFWWFLYQATGTMTRSSVGDLDEWDNLPFLVKFASVLFRFGTMTQNAFGTLGWADTPIPIFFYVIWILVGTAVVASLCGGSRKLSVKPWMAGAVVLGSMVIITIESIHAGFGWQGRYWLPPLCAAIILMTPAISRGASHEAKMTKCLRITLGVVATVSVIAVIFNMWRYQYGFDDVFVRFAELPYPWRSPAWIPAGGSGLFYVAAILGPVLGLVTIACWQFLSRDHEMLEEQDDLNQDVIGIEPVHGLQVSANVSNSETERS